MKIVNNKYQVKSREFVERYPNIMQIVDWFALSVEERKQYKNQPSKFPCIFENDEFYNFDTDTELIQLVLGLKLTSFEKELSELIEKEYTPNQQQVLILEALSGNEDAQAVQTWFKNNLNLLKEKSAEIMTLENLADIVRFKIEWIEMPETLKPFLEII